MAKSSFGGIRTDQFVAAAGFCAWWWLGWLADSAQEIVEGIWGLRLGWRFGRWAVVADPYVQLGLLNQDRGNRNSVHVPVWLRVQPTCRWQVALRTGFDSDFAVLRDGWHGALGGVVTAVVRPDVDLELSGGVRSAFGPQNTAKERSVALAVIFRR